MASNPQNKIFIEKSEIYREKSLQPENINSFEEEKEHKSNQSYNEEKYNNFKAPLPSRKHKKVSTLQKRIKDKKPTILRQIENIANPEEIVIKETQKSSLNRGARTQRRSKYIGVVKNSPKFHTFIVIDGFKTYIGTYKSEEEAAKAYDYYSILLHELSAMTNFSYTKREIELMFTTQQE